MNFEVLCSALKVAFCFLLFCFSSGICCLRASLRHCSPLLIWTNLNPPCLLPAVFLSWSIWFHFPVVFFQWDVYFFHSEESFSWIFQQVWGLRLLDLFNVTFTWSFLHLSLIWSLWDSCFCEPFTDSSVYTFFLSGACRVVVVLFFTSYCSYHTAVDILWVLLLLSIQPHSKDLENCLQCSCFEDVFWSHFLLFWFWCHLFLCFCTPENVGESQKIYWLHNHII